MSDLTLPDARNERDQLAGRTDVLDRVGVLRTLPDGMHVTTPMVAEFYGVDVDTIRKTVIRNRDEFDADGYTVMKPSEVSDKMSLTPSELGFPNGTSQVALFPRRAVLRVGMLLRDSETAREVRTYLLDAERPDATVHFLVPKSLPEALRAYANEVEAHELTAAERDAAQAANKVLAHRIEKDAPLVAKAEAHSGSNGTVHRQAFAREVQQWGTLRGLKVLHEYVYELLRRKGMLVAGERSDRNHATAHAVTSGWAWTKKDTTVDGHATATTYLHPKGQDLAWKWITAHVEQFGTLAPQDVAG